MQWKLLKNSLPKYSIEMMETWMDSVLQGDVLDRNLMAFVAEGGACNVVPRFRVQTNRWSNDKESKFLEIIAKDTINLSEDSVGNDLKGVSGVPTRTR